MTAGAALAMLTAVVAVVIGYWSGLAEAVEPPDSDSRVFLTAFASVAGAILAFLTLYLGQRYEPRPGWIAGLAVVATTVGALAWFTYEGHREERVAVVRHGDGETEQVIITERVTEAAVQTALDYRLCATDELRPGATRVSTACAKTLATNLYGAPWVFDPEGVAESKRILVGWYRVAALAFMLALFLVVDAIVAGVLKVRAQPGAPSAVTPP